MEIGSEQVNRGLNSLELFTFFCIKFYKLRKYITILCITISYTKINVEQTNICHNYHGCYGNIAAGRGKRITMGDTIFQNFCFQTFFFPLRH